MTSDGSKCSNEKVYDNTKTFSRKGPAKHWLFTFNNYLSTDIIYIIEELGKIKALYVFQEEIGEEEGTPHLQGYVTFTSKIRPLSLGMDKRIHWGDKWGKPVKNTLADRLRAQKYCSDQLKRIEGKPLYSNYMEDVYIAPIYGWQLKLKDICLAPPQRRMFHWWWSDKKGIGKSDFMRYMKKHHDAQEIKINKLKDVYNMIVEWNEGNGYYPKLFIQDLPRERDSRKLKFDNIEEFKNGSFFSSKFHAQSHVMNYPTLVFISNHPVDDYHRELYKDRLLEVHIDDVIEELKEKP